MSKIIYSKSFEKQREADDKEFEALSKLPKDTSKAKQFLYDLEHNMEYVENEERMLHKDTFIRAVKNFSNAFEFDYTIEQREFGVCANIKAAPMFSILGSFKSYFADLVDACDDIDFITNKDYILISVTYHTHDQYFNGRKVNSYV